MRLVNGHAIRCITNALSDRPAARQTRKDHHTSRSAALLRLGGVSASYPANGRLGADTVHNINLDVYRGETLAIVGESGSGKSTLARTITGLHPMRAGRIELNGVCLPPAAQDRNSEQFRQVQLIFQNPDSSLNPRQTVAQTIARPLHTLLGLRGAELTKRLAGLLREVQLSPSHADRYPRNLSGGEKQRVAIACALAADPDLLVCDEITSALDVSVQASIIALLEGRMAMRDLSILFITHDLSVVGAFADRVAVMKEGEICEIGDTATVLQAPAHSYTSHLLAAAPRL